MGAADPPRRRPIVHEEGGGCRAGSCGRSPHFDTRGGWKFPVEPIDSQRVAVPLRDRLGIAIVGLGRMGSFHAAALEHVSEIDVVALVDPRAEALARATDRYPAAVPLTDVGDALRLDACEAVLVASPTPHHPEVVATALDAGRHVLCEKPLALDPDAAAELARTARSGSRVLQVGHWRRFAPPWIAARDAVVSGRIGQPILLRLSQWDADPPPPEFCDPAVSGGLAVDCGVHEFDLAEWLTGSTITEVEAHSLPLVEPAIGAVGDVDNLLITGRLANDAGFVIDLSRNSRYGDDVRTEILGSEGVVVVELLPEGVARIATRNGVAELDRSRTTDAILAGLRAQAIAFARRIRGADAPVPDGEASARSVRAARAAMSSLESGRRVELS